MLRILISTSTYLHLGDFSDMIQRSHYIQPKIIRRHKMEDKRSEKDRRENPDRRKDGKSSYNGIDKRKMEYRRLDIERREEEISS
jgi:hypothetical protein